MSESKLIHYLVSTSKLIPYAVAASRRLRPKTRLTPLRFTNVGAETAHIYFNEGHTIAAVRLKYRYVGMQEFENWDGQVGIEPGEYIDIIGRNERMQGFFGRFSMDGGVIAASGNIMSLIYGEWTTRDATIIPEGLRFGTDYGVGMFMYCETLTTPPELPATTLTSFCYANMFDGCTNLTTVPELPAAILKQGCYRYMFQNCTSLTTAPQLPATTLIQECYEGMFIGTSITSIKLPATALVYKCYVYMFAGCTSLTNIEVGFTSWGESPYETEGWVYGVAVNGIFTCPSALDSTQFGDDRIPTGWIVVPV